MIGNRAKYLMLEDTGSDVEIAFFDFKENGMEIDFHISVNGAEALDYLFTEDGSFRIEPPEVIFLDLHMPKTSGLEFLRIIKSNAQSNNIPVVVLLSSASPSEIDECKRLGVKRFIQKPLEYENFISAIKDIDKY
ncbi:MAG: response regulator [Deltaproteobacteria bacterium]|nr:response regulator [Deltaproteobacteria bacterium]